MARKKRKFDSHSITKGALSAVWNRDAFVLALIARLGYMQVVNQDFIRISWQGQQDQDYH